MAQTDGAAAATGFDAGHRPRLLVVDDQPINLRALYEVFSADHQVFMATSGTQALAVCAAKLPDMVLLDVEMPGMDGYEVCQRLKRDAATRDIPVIFITAHAGEAAETRCLDAGAVDFIAKPVNPRTVRARVKTHLTLKTQADLLRQWAYIDALTGVHNRRFFNERLDVEWARAVRTGSALSIVMMDVDFFKRFNDHYGHQAGDECLQRVGRALKAGMRRGGDLLARYGGEEFVCLLPETDLAGAMVFAEELRQAILGAQIAHAASDVSPMVTVSAGVSCKLPHQGTRAAELLNAADRQLYVAKAAGRNRVCGASGAAD